MKKTIKIAKTQNTGKIKLAQEEVESLSIQSGVKAGVASFRAPVSFRSSFAS
jgi:hypothetical protein